MKTRTCLLTGAISTAIAVRPNGLPILLQAPQGPKASRPDVRHIGVVARFIDSALKRARGVL